MKVKLVRMFFADGVRFRAGTHDSMSDALFDKLPPSAKVWDGKDFVPVSDLKKAPKVKTEPEVLNKEPDVKKHVPADAGDRLDPKHPQEPKTDSEEAFVNQPATRPVSAGDGVNVGSAGKVVETKVVTEDADGTKTETKTSTKKL